MARLSFTMFGGFLIVTCLLYSVVSEQSVNLLQVNYDSKQPIKSKPDSAFSDEKPLPEVTIGGCFQNNPSNVNNTTNLNSMAPNEDNCNGNFGLATPIGGTAEINSPIIQQPEKRSTGTIVNTPWSMHQPKGINDSLEENPGGAKIWKSRNVSQRESGLRFLDVPKGDDMRIHDLRLEQKYLLFEAFSDLMGYLQPSRFPTDLLREALHLRLPLHLIVFQIVKLDIILIIWIVFWAILALCLPFGVTANLCCPNNIRRLNEDFSVGSDDGIERKTERILGIFLHTLLLLLIAAIVLILAANEQLSRSISQLPMSAQIIYEDVNTFLRNTHMQISFVVTSSTDIAVEGIKKDLEDVEHLFSKPYQEELSTEVGIDIALLALEDLKIEAAKVTSLASELLTDCAATRITSTLMQDELNDISRELTIVKQQCSTRDRALCYTLQYSGYDLMFTVENITSDVKIKQLDRLGVEVIFNKSIEAAKKSFDELPKQVTAEVTPLVADTKNILMKKRTEVYKAVHSLDVLVRSVSESLRTVEESSLDKIQSVADGDIWRWLAVVGVVTLLSLVWGLLLCGAPCGSCGLTSRTIPLLIAGLSLSCFVCLIMWTLGTSAVLVSSHGKGLLCTPLYDYPKFEVIGDLFDEGGVIYEDGLFEKFGEGNNSLKITDVLKYCQRDQPAYQTFHLHHKINVNKVLNYRQWEELKNLFSNFTVATESNLEILGSALQTNLQTLHSSTAVNLTAYRSVASSMITRKDLNSFADQLNTVARQISEPVTARKFDNLAFSVRKVVQNELQKLLDLKNRILFKIMMLEVLLTPLNKKVEQSLSHLKDIQYFLDNEGWQVAEKTRKRFISRLESYLEELYNHVNLKVTKEIGKCQPLWEVFHATRFYLCKLIVDPLNGIAFSSFFLILLFLTLAPVIIKLVEYYRECNDDVLTSISHRHSRDGLLIEDEGIWSSPHSGTPEMQLETIPTFTIERPSISTLITSPISSRSPRQPSPQRIPAPPRPPTSQFSIVSDVPSISRAKSPKKKFSVFTSTLAKAKNLTQMSTTRSRSPRRGRRNHESLRLVEPIAWKSGSTTPRSWI